MIMQWLKRKRNEKEWKKKKIVSLEISSLFENNSKFKLKYKQFFFFSSIALNYYAIANWLIL